MVFINFATIPARDDKIYEYMHSPKKMEEIKIKRHQTPVGQLILGSCRDRLCICDWAASRRRLTNDRRISRYLNAEYEEAESEIIRMTITQLDEYFSGKRLDFSIPVLFSGTPFQCRVWSELMKIPYGTTISYATLAQRIGNPRGVRAVASAIASNPISIIVPCHRVIGSDNRLTGYAGELHTKQTLLTMENSEI